MKLLAGSILILLFLDGFYSAPLINYGDENGHYKERHSSNRWGRTFGVGLNLGVEAGVKDGVASLNSKNHLGFDYSGYNDDSSKEFEYPIYPRPQPSHFGLSFDDPSQYYPTYDSPYDMHDSPHFFPPYYPYNPVEYPPQYPFYYPSQYPPQYWQQHDTQYQSGHGSQYDHQHPPLYDPQNAPHHENPVHQRDNEQTTNSSQNINEEDLQ